MLNLHWKRLLLVALFGLSWFLARPAQKALAMDIPGQEAATPTESVIQLASQTESDAAQAVTADDLNQRVDASEATTLRLSDDIGVMADRIGEMADRILWTEGQIGVMADRIVESEYLIADSALAVGEMGQESTPEVPNAPEAPGLP